MDINNTLDLTDKSILITGGTGSFGRCFIKTILKHFNPQRIAVFSRDEHKQYDMVQELGPDKRRVRMFIGDVRDRDRLVMAMRGVEYVVHAAALKHVPTAEYNPFECINTNVIGAENVVFAAIQNDVRRVIALSTDKAANPVNLYGASKLAADKIMVAGNSMSGLDGARFAVVRYGNVIGSRGSVVPLFQRLIAEGADSLPITDPEMTRFWIRLQHGVDFVLSCFSMMGGGEIFVPKTPSMKLTDLARCMAPHLPQKTIGIRPGEKLHEVLVTENDARHSVELPDCYVIEPEFVFWRQDPATYDGQPVPEGFRYASNTNTQWLDDESITAMLEALAQ